MAVECFAEPSGGRAPRLGTAGIVAVPGLCSPGWRRLGCQPAAAGSALSFANAAASSVAPGPGALQVQFCATAGEREPGGDVQESVAQPLWLGFLKLAVEQQRLGPDDQVVREHHDLEPHLVELKLLERQLRQAGVLVIADTVLDAGALAVATLDQRNVLVGLVGEDRLEAVPVGVGERQLRARVRALARTITRDPSGQEDRSTCSVISAASASSSMSRRIRVPLVKMENGLAASLSAPMMPGISW